MHPQITNIPETKKSRSEALTSQELRRFKSYANSFTTRQACAKALGLKSRDVVTDVINRGSGHPDTIAAIRKAIDPVNAA